MSDCKADLTLNHHWVNVKSETDVYESLKSLLDVDADLTYNEEEFREDTINLGYEDEAERIVKEILLKNKVDSIESYKKVANEVAEHILNQEYYGTCELSFVSTTQDCLIIAFATGGN